MLAGLGEGVEEGWGEAFERGVPVDEDAVGGLEAGCQGGACKWVLVVNMEGELCGMTGEGGLSIRISLHEEGIGVMVPRCCGACGDGVTVAGQQD